MITKKYTPEEALNEIRLRMVYDSSKTLNENLETVGAVDVNKNPNYYKRRVEELMQVPDNEWWNVKFGTPTVNAKMASNTIYKAIAGAGTTPGALFHIIDTAMKTLADSVAIIKSYQSPDRENETLWEALEGEWFDGGSMEKLINKVAGQLKTWCVSDVKHKKVPICEVLTDNELNYGKY
jgi:Zn-finger nucleic acid-binding protein